jgi:hypothetical protein
LAEKNVVHALIGYGAVIRACTTKERICPEQSLRPDELSILKMPD